MTNSLQKGFVETFFMNKSFCIVIEISLRFIFVQTIDNTSSVIFSVIGLGILLI